MNPLKESTLGFNLENCNCLIESNRIQLTFCSIKVDKSLLGTQKIHITPPMVLLRCIIEIGQLGRNEKEMEQELSRYRERNVPKLWFLRIQFNLKKNPHGELHNISLTPTKISKHPSIFQTPCVKKTKKLHDG